MNPAINLILALIFSSVVMSAAAESATNKAKLPKPAPEEINTYTQDGVWKPIAAVLGGVPLPKPSLDAITLRMTGDSYEVTVTGEGTDKGNCKREPGTIPKRMTITSTNGPNSGKTFLAIYEMKDTNSMRICYDLSGAEFPREFKAPKGTKLYLVGYRRQKE